MTPEQRAEWVAILKNIVEAPETPYSGIVVVDEADFTRVKEGEG